MLDALAIAWNKKKKKKQNINALSAASEFFLSRSYVGINR